MAIPTAMLLLAATTAPVPAAPPPAAPCLLIGDSRAVRLAPFKPDCVLAAKNGITSSEVLALAPPDAGFARVIVSMGGNDWRTKAPLADNLGRLRKLYPRSAFVWLAPRKGENAEIVANFGMLVTHIAPLLRRSAPPPA